MELSQQNQILLTENKQLKEKLNKISEFIEKAEQNKILNSKDYYITYREGEKAIDYTDTGTDWDKIYKACYTLEGIKNVVN